MSNLEFLPNVSVLEFDSICRICFSQTDLKSFEEEGDLLELFLHITKINVEHQKKLTRNVCNSCINTLIDILTFIELSKYNNAAIRQSTEDEMIESKSGIDREYSHVQMSTLPISKTVSLNSSKTCRICASLKNLVPFEDESQMSVFQCITDIDIHSEILHYLICKKCIQKLEDISEFINSSKLKDAILHQALVNKEAWEDFPECEKIILKVERSDSENKPSVGIKSENTEHLDSVLNSSNTPFDYIELKPNVKEEKIDIFHNEGNIRETKCKIEDTIFSESVHSESTTNRKDIRSVPAFNIIQRKFEDKVFLTHKGQNELQCEVCRKSFYTLHSKNKHVASHFGKSPVLCAICGKLFVGKAEYLIHYRVHRLKEPRVKCGVCSQLVLKRQIKEHSELHSNNHKSYCVERPFQCDTCGQTFTQNQHLNRHKRIHYEEKPFPCDICPSRFFQLTHLRAHKSLHTRGNRSECEICHKIFSSASDLMRHMARHTRKRPTCEICGQTFSQHSNLMWHVKSHTTQKKRCEICSSVFASNYGLERHMRAHTGEKPFKCELCPKAFSQRSGLRVHFNVHNSENSCHLCSETFSTEESLKIHLREHSGKESLTCDICLRVFSKKSSLLDHERMHTGEKPFKCDICPKSFSQQRYLANHISKHAKNQPQCEVCFKYFTQEQRLKVHMRMHTGEKPQCEICNKIFVRQGELNVHMKKHNQEKSFPCEICAKAFVRKCDLVKHSKTHIKKHTEDKPLKCVSVRKP